MAWEATNRQMAHQAILQALPARQRMTGKKSSSRRAVRARDAWSPRSALVKPCTSAGKEALS